jgi:excisionase family DNA binding protein
MTLHTVREAAEQLRCSPATIYLLCAAGKLKCSREGLGRGKLLISSEAIAAYLNNGTGEAVPAPPPHRPRPKFKFIHLKQA